MDEAYKDHDELTIVDEAIMCGITKMCNVGYDLKTSQQALNQAIMYPEVYSAVGIHPNNVAHHESTDLAQITKLAQSPSTVAIGEIGLDYFRMGASKELQKQWFIAQLRIAKKLKLPVLVHCREAYDDCYEILKQEKITRGVMHCFLGSPEQARQFMDLGFYISFTGIITFNNAQDLIPTVESIPLNKLLVETDAPYLAPEPYRGKINFPKNIVYTVKAIARMKHIGEADVIRVTSKNANDLFQIN